jgi:hypothetical protein
MDQATLVEEAEKCRHQALAYLGTREASILIRIASEFDDLAGRVRQRAAPSSASQH